jgi:acyl-CoA dehydrogenase
LQKSSPDLSLKPGLKCASACNAREPLVPTEPIATILRELCPQLFRIAAGGQNWTAASLNPGYARFRLRPNPCYGHALPAQNVRARTARPLPARNQRMDFELPQELRLLKDSVRRFVDRELIPLERDVVNDVRMQKQLPQRLRGKAEPLGLWLYDVPQEFGGLGLGMLARIVVWSELGRTTALPARNVNIFGPPVSPILYKLEGEAREKYLMPVIRGEKRSCFAQTEADAGSDPAAMRTTAVRRGDHYVINGVKRFITGADEADFAQVFALTDPVKRGRGGISAFLVDMDSPGVKVAAAYDLMVDDKPCEIIFDKVRVAAANLIGREGEGFRLAQAWINDGRIRHGARSLGVIERCLELAISYAKQRKTFGALLAQRQSIQWPILDMHMDAHKLRLMLHHVGWKFDRGEDCRTEAFMVKIFGDERSFWAADRCLQIHGGIGLSKELPIERFFRDQRSMMITEGSIEVLRMALARMLLDLKPPV